MAGAGCDRVTRCLEASVGVANTDAHPPAGRLGDDFARSLEFRRDGHEFDVAARGLPEPLEHFESWWQEALRRMHTAPDVAEEGALQVDAQGARSPGLVSYRGGFDGTGKPIERDERLVDRRRHRGGEVTGDPMTEEKPLKGGKGVCPGLHNVVPGTAVNVHIDEAGHQDRFSKVDQAITPS